MVEIKEKQKQSNQITEVNIEFCKSFSQGAGCMYLKEGVCSYEKK